MLNNTKDRHESIISCLQTRNFVSVSDLAAMFQVSESTIKRDLNALAKKHPIRRTHGGVFLRGDVLDPYNLRSGKSSAMKRQIASRANQFIEDGDTIFIEAGTTCFSLYQQITARDLTIFTTSTSIATTTSNYTNSVYLLGGEVDITHMAVHGSLCIENLRQIAPKKFFLSCSGLGENYEMLTKYASSRLFHQQLLAMPGEKIFMVDSTKIHYSGTGMFRSSSIQSMDVIITDSGISAEDEKMIRALGVELIVV